MQKRKDIVFALDGDDLFAHFKNPEWVKKMQAKAKKFAALASSSEKSQQAAKRTDAPASGAECR